MKAAPTNKRASGTAAGLFILTVFSFGFSCAFCQGASEKVLVQDDAATRRLETLLVKPECLKTFVDSVKSYRIENVSIPSGDIMLSGMLYEPLSGGPWPCVVFMHGGGNDVNMIMSGPKWYAALLAHSGIAALVYDKRGTGKSGGAFEKADYDDFIDDAGHAAMVLSRDSRIDPRRIAVYGGSEGGRLAPCAAVRFPVISLVFTVSGPVGSVADQATYNMDHALRSRGFADSTVDRVMPLWKRHHEAFAKRDKKEFRALAGEIKRLRYGTDPFVIPSTYEEIMTDSGLFFLRPGFNSMPKDYTEELRKLKKPWLALFGEFDPILDVKESMENIRVQMKKAGNTACEMFMVRGVGHSLINPNTGRPIGTSSILINWLKERWGG